MLDKGSIVVCDDNGTRAEGWASSIRAIPEVNAKYTVTALTPELFGAGFEALRQRQLGARFGERRPDRATDEAAVFDTADIVIVDFDLTPTDRSEVTTPEQDDAPATKMADEPRWVQELSGSFGNVFVYLLRCYTSASFTVLVNQDFPKSTFDLTMRRFDFSYADLNVADPDLKRPALWTGQPDREEPPTFRPWHWPRLIDAPERLRQIIAGIDLDANVFDTLGLSDPAVMSQIHADQLEGLGLRDFEKPSLDFRTFATKTRFGMLVSDTLFDDSDLPKLAATAVSHWLERLVLPAQNVLVDAPHLVQRQPALTELDPAEWDALADLANPEAVVAAISGHGIEDAVTPATGWTSRPVWCWPKAPRNATNLTAEFPVFCEDISRFRAIDDAVEFVSSVAGPLRQRFVVELEQESGKMAIEYDPYLRLL